MPANSLSRRIIKRLLEPIANGPTYGVLQACAMSWDIKTRAWFEPEIELLSHAMKPGETAIDIGANYGLYAYHLSRIVGPDGRVYCFEPIPFTADTFGKIARILRFHEVTLIRKGVGETNGRVEFTVPVTELGSISAGLAHMGRIDARPGGAHDAKFPRKNQKIRCEVVSIDDALPGLRELSLIKCDIEGADLFAMRGAARSITQHRPTVIIEITPWFLEGFGLTVSDIYQFFEDRDYRCYHYHGKELIQAGVADIVEGNWVFVHPSREGRFGSFLRGKA
jgi:FkbM family methyltransferase